MENMGYRNRPSEVVKFTQITVASGGYNKLIELLKAAA